MEMGKNILFKGLLLVGLLMSSSCTKDEVNLDSLKKIYAIYKQGQISVCHHKSVLVYKAELSATDTGFQIFDQNGNQIGDCNTAWGQKPDYICDQITKCETIYRIKDDILGIPGINKYNLK